MKKPSLMRLVNWWPPLLFNAIRATRISQDFREIDVQLKLRFYNRNYVGAHFGGNLFSMTDPWYMLMLMHNLGSDYFVWDKKASIDFIAPGRGKVRAHFRLSEADIDTIKAQTASGEKYFPEFVVDIFGEDNQVVARVHKTLYVKLKPHRKHLPTNNHNSAINHSATKKHGFTTHHSSAKNNGSST